MEQQIKKLLQQSDQFSNLDLHFADFLTRLEGNWTLELYLAAALVSRSRSQGHICLDLHQVAGASLFDGEPSDPFPCPEYHHWLNKLNRSIVVGSPGEFTPLILDEAGRLYLYRYWDYQQQLANALRLRLDQTEMIADFESLAAKLDRYFPPATDHEIDWQKIAALTAWQNRFCVISGGPGTGKTTTIVRLLALLLENGPLRTALAAPTGKAAARLQEAIKQNKGRLNCDEAVRNAIPEQASTIHRLLGTIPNSPYFRYNAQNPLPLDVMIVDEASMVDLALMSKLVQALPATCRLILVGDKDQLASVEAGAVLGDICDTGHEHPYSAQFCARVKAITGVDLSQPSSASRSGLQDAIVQLKKNYRFASHSAIGAASRLVNAGAGAQALAMLQDPKSSDAQWIPLPPANVLAQRLRTSILNGYRHYLNTNDPIEALQRFDQFRILCALRDGPYGITNLNAIVETVLRQEKLISMDQPWYHGRPILITSNDYQLNLFNGDVGMALRDPESNDEIRVFFIGSDQMIRKFHPLRLPAHDTVFAMTVHKSQGSEFDHVLLLLPDRDVPILTRELIYTGITRARTKVEVWGIESIFKNAVSRRIERTSGLRDALWDVF